MAATLPNPFNVAELTYALRRLTGEQAGTLIVTGDPDVGPCQVSSTTWSDATILNAYNTLPWTPRQPGPPAPDPLGAYVAFSQLGQWYLDDYSGTDDQKMASALADWSASTAGGTIFLPPRLCSFSEQWATHYVDDTTVMYLGIKGAGFAANGRWSPPTAVTIADHTYNGTGAAKADFHHVGTVEMTGLLMRDPSGGTVPMVLCTNTQPQIHDMGFEGSQTGTSCDQDAIILGGTATGAATDSDTSPFQGYGGTIRRVFISGIRRLVIGQTYCNGITVEENTVSASCGSNLSDDAAIVFTGGSGGDCSGNNIIHNTVEVSNYAFLASFAYCVDNTIGPNGAYDNTATTVAAYSLGTNTSGNRITDGYRSGALPLAIDQNGTNDLISVQYGSEYHSQRSFFNGGAVAPSGFRSQDPAGDQAWLDINPSTYPNPQVDVMCRARTQFTDLVTTSGSRMCTSASASFTVDDIGQTIDTANLPAWTRILAVQSSTQIMVSNEATASGTAQTFSLYRFSGTLWTLATFAMNHYITTGNTPTVSPEAALDGGTCSIAGTDMAGTVTATPAGTPVAGFLFAVGVTHSFSGQPRVIWQPANAAAAGLPTYDGSTTANLELYSTTAPAASTEYIWNYLVLQ